MEPANRNTPAKRFAGIVSQPEKEHPMAEETPRLESETAHILFMDVVSYSLLPMEKQNAVSQQLMEAVSATSEYKRATERNELVCLDTGDGLILIFARDPVAPVICAIEVAQAVGATLPMRIGINSGHVSRIRDINNQVNIRGTAINMAQRIMNCGDAGHILISARDAEDLITMSNGSPNLLIWANAASSMTFPFTFTTCIPARQATKPCLLRCWRRVSPMLRRLSLGVGLLCRLPVEPFCRRQGERG